MTAQDLEQCRTYRKRIRALDNRIEELRSEAERVTRRLSLAPYAPPSRDVMAAYAAQIDELERQRAELMQEREQHYSYLERELLAFPVQQAEVLRLRYVQDYKWAEVARRTSYTPEHCRKILVVAKRKMDTQ